MVPTRPLDAVVIQTSTNPSIAAQQTTGGASVEVECAQQGGLDAISEVSTTDGDTPKESPASQWTSVAARRKPKQPLVNQSLANVAAAPATRAAAVPPQAAKPKVPDSYSKRIEGPIVARKYEGSATKGKGLSHFQRVEVGIEDDPEFRVVQRLIGPKGRHMQDIITTSKGAKVWIIGRGSRSWEDDVGPLQICVGAATSAVFDSAVAQVQALLGKVREEHGKFRQ